jgi:exosortase
LDRSSRLLLILKISTLAVCTLIIFHQDLIIVFNDALQNETTSHILAIPFLFAYMIYRKRRVLRATVPLENIDQPKRVRRLPATAGALLAATAILLYWHGSHTFTPLEYHMLALPIFVSGLTLMLFNVQTMRELAFPIIFLTFLTPPPSEILYMVGSALSTISSEASAALAKTLGIPSAIISEYENPTIIITRPDGSKLSFTVDIACSGIHSLIGFLIFAAFIAYIIRDKAWKKIATAIIGLPLIYLLNIIRITTILTIGYHFGDELAMQIFHLLGGWALIFLGTLMLLATSDKAFKTKIFTSTAEKCPECSGTPQPNQTFCQKCGRIIKPEKIKVKGAEIAKIAAIIICIASLTSIQTPVFAITQGPPTVIVDTPSGQQNLTEILPQISDYSLVFLYRDREFERKAKQDMSLVYLYAPQKQASNPKDPVTVAVEIASTRSSLHRWEYCLVTYPTLKGYRPKAEQIELKDVELTQNPPIIGRYFVFNYTPTGTVQAVLYWYETATFKTNSTTQQKNVKISLIAYPENMEDLPKIESQLVNIARAIVNYWQPIKTWSQISIMISQNSLSLIAAMPITLIALATLQVAEARKEKRANATVYNKLSKINRQTVEAVMKAEKESTPTLSNIAEAYQKITGQPIDEEMLLERLSEIEKTEIIKSIIANRDDEPIKAWRTQIAIK